MGWLQNNRKRDNNATSYQSYWTGASKLRLNFSVDGKLFYFIWPIIIISFCLFLFLLMQLLELFGAGTACIVSPVDRINYLGSDYLVPTMEQKNPVYGRIRDTLTEIQYGKIEHPWATVID